MDKTTFEIITASLAAIFLVLYLMRRSARRRRMMQ